MSEQEQSIEPSVSEARDEPQLKGTLLPELDQAFIEERMEGIIEVGLLNAASGNEVDPKEIVKRLLAVQGANGAKLVWTRHDVFAAFGILHRKLTGAERVGRGLL